MDYEQLQQEESLYPWINDNADLLDAMADIAYEQEQAMREEYDNDTKQTEVYDDQT
jgi:hypothetical protein